MPKKCSNYRIIALISHASEVMLKIPHARLQQYMNQELPDVQAGIRKDRGTRDQIAKISELKWTGMGEFNSGDQYIYYCGQESPRRNGVAIMVNKRV